MEKSGCNIALGMLCCNSKVAMLKEIKNVSQPQGEPPRRWFSSSDTDLIVWYNASEIIGFQLCYDRGIDEHALTWMRGQGFTHRRIEDGESKGMQHKMTPILVPDGVVDISRVTKDFELQSEEIDAVVRGFVMKYLAEFERDN